MIIWIPLKSQAQIKRAILFVALRSILAMLTLITRKTAKNISSVFYKLVGWWKGVKLQGAWYWKFLCISIHYIFIENGMLRDLKLAISMEYLAWYLNGCLLLTLTQRIVESDNRLHLIKLYFTWRACYFLRYIYYYSDQSINESTTRMEIGLELLTL